MLLRGLKEQLEAEIDRDERLYEKFVCWGKDIIRQKRASNAMADAELKELTQYVSDLDSGRTELTSERHDLVTEIGEITTSLEVAEATRKKEKADYEDAANEMDQAIIALTSAIDVLRQATQDHKEGVFMATRAEADQTFQSAAAETKAIHYAANLGDKFLSTVDAVFLRRVLTGEVPKWDWQKLNRRATFKMSYKARSFKIQDTLHSLLATFEANRAQAERKEGDAQALHDKLMASKGQELASAKQNLVNMDKENGAKTMSREETTARIDLLDEQATNDNKYIKQVEQQLADKKVQWTARAKLRSGEIKAISEAIYTLGNDDTRNVMQRSFNSQGYNFLQTSTTSSARNNAANVLQKAALEVHDGRLLSLVASVRRSEATAAPAPTPAGSSPMQQVIDAIDAMLGNLQQEQADDLAAKEKCEEDRAENTREAVKASRAIDEYTDAIALNVENAKQLLEKINQNNEILGEIREEMSAIEVQRNEEHAEWVKADRDDEEAASTVESAKGILQHFYMQNNLMLVQGAQNHATEQVPNGAGEAPPPPPRTWDTPYKGATPESSGIIAILSMIHEDIVYDRTQAKEAEDKAKSDYGINMQTLRDEKRVLTDQTDQLETDRLDQLNRADTDRQTRNTQKIFKLDRTLATIASKEPTCNYFTVNYPARTKNRQIETDGLIKAKAILQGGVFDAPDPGRELVPRDALL